MRPCTYVRYREDHTVANLLLRLYIVVRRSSQAVVFQKHNVVDNNDFVAKLGRA